MAQVKLLVIGDLHGNLPKIMRHDFDAIIAPGDFCSDNLRKYMVEAIKINKENPTKKIRWEDLIGKKMAKVEVKKSLKDGKNILERLNSFNKPVFLVPGNWDWAETESKWIYLKKDHFKTLLSGLSNLINCHLKKIEFKGIIIIGSGISSRPEVPQSPEEVKHLTISELKIKKKDYSNKIKLLASYFKKESRPILLLSHNVPFNTPIDEITNKESPRFGAHYGSLIARELIDIFQPLLCIGGHMHEHFKSVNIGKTTCINSGFGSSVNVYLTIENGKILNLEFLKDESVA